MRCSAHHYTQARIYARVRACSVKEIVVARARGQCTSRLFGFIVCLPRHEKIIINKIHFLKAPEGIAI